MAVGAWLENTFDRYSRVARLYPTLFALAPIIWSVLALYPTLLDNVAHSTIFAVAAACLSYFLASVARYRGKMVEARLIQKWGGWPTTIFLRHRDTTIDSITKSRYHDALNALCTVHMPSTPEEKNDLARADDIYRSATKRLIELRRGSQFELIHKENASYGFRRNLLGMKPIAIAVILIAGLLTAGAWWLITPQPYTRLVIVESVVRYPYLPLLFSLDAGYLCLWMWIINEKFVFQGAREYAEALLRSLDG